MNSNVLVELLPALSFFISYKLYGMKIATIVIICATLVSLTISYIKHKKLSPLAIIASLFLLILGTISIITNNLNFLKIKPTIIYLIFASIVGIGLLRNKIVIKSVLGNIIELDEKQWTTISKQWLAFFCLCAVLNEIVWRNFSEENWVNFKVFVIPLLTLLLTIIQLLYWKNNIKVKD